MPHDTKNLNDANPMKRRVPAESISRRRRVEPQPPEKDAVLTVDRKAIFVMKPDQRAKWLIKALKQASEGRIRTSDLYDVIVSTRFIEDVPVRAGRKMERAVREQLSLFSGKQQRFLSSEAAITVKFGQQADDAPGQADEAPGVTEQAESRAEEMMARCRDFVREKMVERGELGSAPSAGEIPGETLLLAEAKAPLLDSADGEFAVSVPPQIVVTAATKPTPRKSEVAAPRKPEDLGFEAAETPGLARSASPPRRPETRKTRSCSRSRSRGTPPAPVEEVREQRPTRKEGTRDRSPHDRHPRRRRRGSSVSSRSAGARRRKRPRPSSSGSEPSCRRRRPRRAFH
uniref:Uncharacterized protein n=1 Tax=Noctiluca scintillans TaxID=2966 RepID=A0A7S1AFL3_NOCSC